MAAKIIKKINLNGESYDIYAYSAISAYSAEYANVAKTIDGDISWSSISGLAVVSGNASVTGFWTPTAISANINQAIKDNINNLGTVYHFEGAIGELPSNTTNITKGSVYNVTEIIDLGGNTIDGDDVSAFPGDNIVWTGEGWDKLAATVSLDGYATEQWVQDRILSEENNYVDQHLVTATSGQIFSNQTSEDNAWKAVTDYVDAATNNLTSADYWNYAYETVTASADDWNATTEAVNASAEFWNYAYDSISDAIKTAAELSAAATGTDDEKAKLVQAGAITDYIEDKIAETIAETIEIAHEITDDTDGSLIPDVDAIRGVSATLMDHAETSGVNIHYYADDESLHIFTQYEGSHPANANDK